MTVIMAAYQQQGIRVLPGNVQPPTEITPIGTGESTSLLTSNPIAAQSRWRCCVQSKATVLILVWNLCIAIGLEFFSLTLLLPDTLDNIVRIIVYGILAVFLLFYPLAGYLADVHWGRYKTIHGSIRFLLLSLLIIIFLGIFGTCMTLAIVFTIDYDYSYETLGPIKIVSIVVLCLAFGLPILFGIFLILFSLVAFSANVIQYGIDQLEYDARGENFVQYVHWYVWTCYMAEFIIKIMITIFGSGFSLLINSFIFLIVLPIVIGISFCIRESSVYDWVLVNTPPQTENPYKLIYQIIKFAVNHNNSSLHTCTQNETMPSSRLDLAKERYGGPFTSSKVDEVKSFLQIFCILLTLGPILMADIAIRELLPKLVFHMDRYPLLASVIYLYDQTYTYDPLKSLISGGALTPLIIVIVLPLYMYVLRPCLYNYIPRDLKRIGLGMGFIFLSALCTLLMDTSGHLRELHYWNATWLPPTTCFLNADYHYYYPNYDDVVPILHISSYVLTIQCILNAIGYMLFYISTFEFICAQSPRFVKGVLICSFFAIKGAFRLLGDLVLYAPFTAWNVPYAFPSCGFVYYLINTLLVLVGIVAFAIAAKKYQRQTPPHYDEQYPNAEG